MDKQEQAWGRMALSVTRLLLATSVLLLLGMTLLGWRTRTNHGAGIFAVLQGCSALWAGLTLAGPFLSPGPSDSESGV